VHPGQVQGAVRAAEHGVVEAVGGRLDDLAEVVLDLAVRRDLLAARGEGDGDVQLVRHVGVILLDILEVLG
jgi:hypothetical protein